MKHILYFPRPLLLALFFFSPLFLGAPAVVTAQWEPERKLTNKAKPHPGLTDYECAWRLSAGPSGVIHAVWQDERDGNLEIYYKRSTDSGTSWSRDKRLTKSKNESWCPALSVSGNYVHVVWVDKRNGSLEIYYKRSSDKGENWSKDVRLTRDSAFWPSIFTEGTMVYIVWSCLQFRNSTGTIFYIRSTNSGRNWSQAEPVPNALNNAGFPSVVSSGRTVYVAWGDIPREGMPRTQVYCERSTDSGIHWEKPLCLNEIIATAGFPKVVGSSTDVFVIWDGGLSLYYNRSTDGGASWGKEIRLSQHAAIAHFPSVSVSGNNLHVAWQDQRHGGYNPIIYYKTSSDYGATWSQDLPLTSDRVYAESPSIAIQDSMVHVIYSSYIDGNWDLYYRRNQTGNRVKY